jgi:L-asparaginase
MRQITLITTGGTIEKTYDERTGSLENRHTVVGRMLRRLRLEDTNINIVELMSKDSALMDDGDRRRIVDTVRAMGADPDTETPTTGIVILHGTDTLEKTGAALLKAMPRARVPIVLTGAMRPYEMTRTDALQNLTEAVFATGVLGPGVYCVAHGRALQFPGVMKDWNRATFVQGSYAGG